MPSDDDLMRACETLCRAMYHGFGTAVVGRPNQRGPWVARMDSSHGILMAAAATSKRASIEGLYCALWDEAEWLKAEGCAPARFGAICEAMALTEGMFGLPAEPS